MFKEQLKNALLGANCSAAELSRKTGISKSLISRYLKGEVEPGDARKKILLDALGYRNSSFQNTTAVHQLKSLPVSRAAKLMGKSEEFIRKGLIDERLPFGYAVFMGNKWSYWISPILFSQFTGIELNSD